MADEKHGEGWIAFAIVMALMAGCANGIFGLTAVFSKEAFKEGSLAYVTLQQWGWVLMLFGVLQIVAAIMLAGRKNSGRIFAIVLAALSFLGWMFWVGSLPLAGLTVIVIDILIIYGLSVTKEYFA